METLLSLINGFMTMVSLMRLVLFTKQEDGQTVSSAALWKYAETVNQGKPATFPKNITYIKLMSMVLSRENKK